MARILFIAFIVMTTLEIFIVTQAAGQIGWAVTLVLVVGISMAGAWLVKREGLGVFRRIQGALAAGKMPTDELADGAMILFASALLLTPGFLTDLIGLLLLIPPSRALMRPHVISFFKKRVEVRTVGSPMSGLFGSSMGGSPFGRRPGFGRDVYDVDASADADLTDMDSQVDPDPGTTGELGR